MIFKIGITVNNKVIKTTHYFLNKYDLVKLPSFFISSFKKLYIFCLKFYFDFVSKYSYKNINNIKGKYYIELYKQASRIKDLNRTYITQIKMKFISLNNQMVDYVDLMEDIFYFFFKEKSNKFNSFYNFDILNNYKGNYNVEFQFPFFLKQKKKDLFFNSNINYLGNVSYIVSSTSTVKKSNLFNMSYLNNFMNLYFFLFKYKLYYYYSSHNKFLVSPNIVNTLFKEQKKLFYYFSILYHVNFIKLI
jgi:hypothetical protein